ncbi:MAG TPA: hypothetical protein VLA77_00725 [Candidatus Saccharimonadales bacterium]|nr:hypothetical protein [Candidatus Saccharimonadales bacterium]
MQSDQHRENSLYTPQQQGYDAPEREFDVDAPRPDFIDWKASEYVQHDKGFGWLIAVIAVSLALIGVTVYFKQWTFAVLITVMAVAFCYFGFKKPRIVSYHLTQENLVIDGREYSFKDFRAFSVHEDGAFYSIVLVPVKRLSPAVNIYFGNDQAEAVLNIISDHLPLEKTTPDPFDVIMRRLHF